MNGEISGFNQEQWQKGRNEEKQNFQEGETLYISDLHGNVHEVVNDLLMLLEQKRQKQTMPENIIFLGDIIGCPETQNLQAYFYDYVLNPFLKQIWQKENFPEANFTWDEQNTNLAQGDWQNLPLTEILSKEFTVSNQLLSDCGQIITLREGLQKLISLEQQLQSEAEAWQTKTESAIEKATTPMTEEQLANKLREVLQQRGFQKYIQQFPEILKMAEEKSYESFMTVASVLEQLEIPTWILQGNHEGLPLWSKDRTDFRRDPLQDRKNWREKNKDLHIIDPEEKTIKYLATKVGVVKTGENLQVLLPFGIYYNDAPEFNLEEEVRQAVLSWVNEQDANENEWAGLGLEKMLAKIKGQYQLQNIVVVSHYPMSIDVHNAIEKQKRRLDQDELEEILARNRDRDNKRRESRLEALLEKIKPDVFVYAHQHNQMHDEQGAKIESYGLTETAAAYHLPQEVKVKMSEIIKIAKGTALAKTIRGAFEPERRELVS